MAVLQGGKGFVRHCCVTVPRSLGLPQRGKHCCPACVGTVKAEVLTPLDQPRTTSVEGSERQQKHSRSLLSGKW